LQWDRHAEADASERPAEARPNDRHDEVRRLLGKMRGLDDGMVVGNHATFQLQMKDMVEEIEKEWFWCDGMGQGLRWSRVVARLLQHSKTF
jgi:hypothetical protein